MVDTQRSSITNQAVDPVNGFHVNGVFSSILGIEMGHFRTKTRLESILLGHQDILYCLTCKPKCPEPQGRNIHEAPRSSHAASTSGLGGCRYILCFRKGRSKEAMYGVRSTSRGIGAEKLSV